MTSTALHAAILHDSEVLRVSVPGIECFKLSTAQNAATWYHTRTRLLGPVRRYDVTADAFIPIDEEEEPFSNSKTRSRTSCRPSTSTVSSHCSVSHRCSVPCRRLLAR